MTILAALNVLSGIILLLLGVAVLIVSTHQLRRLLGEVLGGVLGGTFVFLGLICFALAYGLLGGRGWAWITTFVLTIISALVNLINLPWGIAGLIVDGVIIYYLTRPYVRAFFGKNKPLPPP